MLFLALQVQSWTTLTTPEPSSVHALLTGTLAPPAPLDTGGLSYVWPATQLRHLTFAVANDTCTSGDSQSASIVDRLPGTTSCAELRRLVGEAGNAWAASWPEYVEVVDVSDQCMSQYGTVEGSTCSALFGGPALVVVRMDPPSSSGSSLVHPRASSVQTAVGAGDHVRRIALRAHNGRTTPRHTSRAPRTLLDEGVLAVAWIHSRVSSSWTTVDGRGPPRYADGSAHAMLVTSGAIVELSRDADFDWCERDENACEAWAPRSTAACLPLRSVLVHEWGHVVGMSHPEADDHWRADPEPRVGAVTEWSSVVPSTDVSGPRPIMHAIIDAQASSLPTADCLQGVSVLYGLPATNGSLLSATLGCPNNASGWWKHESGDDDDDDDDDEWMDDDEGGGGTILGLWWVWFWLLLAVFFLCPLTYWAWPVAVSDYKHQGEEGP